MTMGRRTEPRFETAVWFVSLCLWKLRRWTEAECLGTNQPGRRHGEKVKRNMGGTCRKHESSE